MTETKGMPHLMRQYLLYSARGGEKTIRIRIERDVRGHGAGECGAVYNLCHARVVRCETAKCQDGSSSPATGSRREAAIAVVENDCVGARRWLALAGASSARDDKRAPGNRRPSAGCYR